jgi:hypothetical protein
MNGLYLITIAASNFPPFPLMDEKIPKPTQIPKMGDWMHWMAGVQIG